MAMTKFHYKNETKEDLTIVGVGVVAAGKTIESDEEINNPSLIPVEQPAQKKSINKDEGDVN